MNTNLIDKIEGILHKQIRQMQAISGGCISDAKRIYLSDGGVLFLKVNTRLPEDMFIKEANGLRELASTGTIRTPQVILAQSDFIILEFIEPIQKSELFFEDFGRSFAHLHRHTNKIFGFVEDNYIGANVQLNIPEGEEKGQWDQFYFNKRILAQYKISEKKGLASTELKNGILKLENKIHSILAGSEEAPSLLHGDLWGGNFIVDDHGKACIIDPAVYYGHREADLAMTKLFSGFAQSFFDAYNEEYSLRPGWEDREDLYKLYHLMNHLNLFGNSYYADVMRILNKYA